VLRVDGVVTYYGEIEILKGIDLEVRHREIVSLLGGNASGKTTTMKTIMGLVRPRAGAIEFRGERIDGLEPADVVARGISSVPEGRRLFPQMTVEENLEMGTFALANPKAHLAEDLERAYALFPRLRERRRQLAGSLSGGEQQMLATARGLMARPTLLLMDEPSMGLAPRLVEQVFDAIVEINRQGTTILLVEQNANMALSIAHRGYVLQTGRIVLHDTGEKLLHNPDIQRAYLGHGAAPPVGIGASP
jgi:branched-chain amino acid transport system ATP-binding protein